MPSQSAQPAPESSISGSSDPFSIFESLKRHPPTALASHNPPKITYSQKPLQLAQTQKRTLETRGKTDTEGKTGSRTKDTVPGPKAGGKKALANSKVKLSALDLEEETGAGKPDIHQPHENDYSLPASNSSSPAAAPAKKGAPAKKQPAQRPAPKSKANARETKATAGKRPKNAKPAPAPPGHQSPEDRSDEERDEDILLVEKPSIVTEAPHEANPPSQVRGRKLESGDSSNDDQRQDVIMVSSDSTSSFPESDNTDDQDFECSRKMTPGIVRRRTRATAARSQAAKEAKGKVESHSAPRPNARRHDSQGERSEVDTAERPKKQPKQPPKKTAADKTPVVATGTESNLESNEKVKPYGGKAKEKSSTSERKTAANRTAKARSEIKQEAAVSSNADRVGRAGANKLGQASDLVNQTKDSYRKPNIVAFGLGGPKNNGRLNQAKATTDSRPQVQQISPVNAEYTAVTKTQQAKGIQKAPKTQLNTAVQDGDSPTNDFIGLAKGGLGRAARASQPTVADAVPDNAPIFNTETKAIVQDFDAEMTTFIDEAGPAELSGQFATGDFEADTAVEDTANVTVGSPDYQNHEMANVFEGKGDGKVLKQPAQAGIEHLLRPEQRTVLGEVDANYRKNPEDVPHVIPRFLKRKIPEVMTVEEESPIQQALASGMGSRSRTFPALRMNSTASNLPSERRGRPVKKPKYDASYAVRVNHDTACTSNPVGGSDNPSPVVGGDIGDDVFGPGKSEPSGSSAFVQRLISNESTDRGLGEDGLVAPAAFDKRAAPRQHTVASNHPATTRSVAPGAGSRLRDKQQPDDVGTRMLEALGPEKAQSPDRWLPSDDRKKRSLVGDTTNSWLSGSFDQRRPSEVDDRAQAWKKATEPYADSLGETMHKIVNVS